MSILIFTASGHGKHSLTLKLAREFAAGFAEVTGDEPDVIDLYKKEVRPCKGCLACWYKTPGKCVIDDDGNKLLNKIRKADHVIWAAPLYVFGFPSEMVKMIDRMMPNIKPDITYDSLGRATHPGIGAENGKHILITSGAFPQIKGNFDGMLFQVKRLFGEDTAVIACCASTTMLLGKKDAFRPYIDSYMQALHQAGKEYGSNGKISEETQKILDQPPMPEKEYVDFVNRK